MKTYIIILAVIYLAVVINQRVQGLITTKDVKTLWILTNNLTDFSWTHHFGIARAELQEKLEARYTDRVFTSDVEYIILADLPDSAKTKLTTKLDQNEYDIVITTSFGLTNIVQEIAPSYPNISFVCISGNPVPIDNVIVISLDYYEAAFLTGYVGGAMSKTNKIGFIMGYPTAVMHTMISATYLGAAKANPDVSMHRIIMNTWGNASIEEGVVEILLAQGCDVITGTTKADIYHKTEGIYSLGQLYDFGTLYGDKVLASYIPNWPPALMPLIIDAIEREKFNTSLITYGMRDSGIPVDLGYISPIIPKEIREGLKEWRQMVLNGSEKIFCGPLDDENDVQRIPAGYCMNQNDLNHLNWVAGGSTNKNLGNYVYPPDSCSSGQYYTVNAKANTYECLTCPAGTYSAIATRNKCTTCPADHYSTEGSSECIACPEGFVANSARSACEQLPFPWYIWVLTFSGTFLIVVICTIVACILGFVAFKLWKKVKRQRRTLKNAELVSSSIAFMQLDNDEIRRFLSLTPETKLDSHFARILNNLKEYRPYLPETLFAVDSEEEGEPLPILSPKNRKDIKKQSMQLAAVVPVPDATSKFISNDTAHNSDTSSQTSASSQQSLSRIRKRMRLGLHERRASLLFIEIKRFSNMLRSNSSINICKVYMNLVDVILNIMKKSKGVYHALIHDKLVCSWNAVSNVSNHEMHAIAACLLLQEEIINLKSEWGEQGLPILEIVGTVASGVINCGNLGTAKVRSFSLLGKTVDHAIAMTQLNMQYGTRFLVLDSTVAAIREEVSFSLVDRLNVTVKEGDSSSDIVDVYQINFLQAESSLLSDWMLSEYVVPVKITPDMNQSLRVYKTAMNDFFDGHVNDAKNLFEEVIRLENHASSPIEHLKEHSQRMLTRIKFDQTECNQFVIVTNPMYY